VTSRSQRQRIFDLLVSARGWVPAPQLAAISLQYSARILELRRLGFRIANKVEVVNGVKHGSFRLEAGMPSASASRPTAQATADDPESLFGDLSPEPRYPD
jgi:hypothetical protein